MSNLPIQHQQFSTGGAFIIRQQDQKLAEMTYANHGHNVVSVDHTWVDPSLRGQGVAQQLLQATVNWARDNGVRLIPRCSYVVDAFNKDRSLYDVLTKS